jgi:hypothetical protein
LLSDGSGSLSVDQIPLIQIKNARIAYSLNPSRKPIFVTQIKQISFYACYSCAHLHGSMYTPRAVSAAPVPAAAALICTRGF